MPLFWSFGSANAMPAIMTHGGCMVLQEAFEPGAALALIERERCSVYYGMANMARALLEHPDHPGRRLGAMRTGLTIGPPEDITLTIQALGAAELCTVYGSTETYGNCAVTDAHDPLPLRLATQGLPLPGMTIRAVDPATRPPLPPGEIGELAVLGYTTPGYFRAPELDAQAFDNGWFLTGDLGSIEPDGRVRFRGRLKEMIKTGGVNVAPLEVEHVLLQHPDIVQAHVVGVPDRLKGEIVAAAVEMRADAEPDAAAITAFCRERLASYKVPTRLAFRAAGEFPRTPTGKIHKPGLRDNWQRTARHRSLILRRRAAPSRRMGNRRSARAHPSRRALRALLRVRWMTYQLAATREECMPGLYYDQFHVGQVFKHPIRRTITEADNVWFSAVTHNPSYLHLDEEYCRTETEFGQRLVNSCFTLCPDGGHLGRRHRAGHRRRQPRLGRGALSQAAVPRRHRAGRIGSAGDAREQVPAGDGIVIFAHRAFNQNGELVAHCKRSSLMKKTPA